jgi:hypothetical protein
MPSSDTTFPITAGLISGLRSLRDAWDCARQMNRSVWEFALEIDTLRSAGLSHTDLRWLLGKGYAEHAVETTRPSEGPRRFRPVRSMTLPMRTCFILTDAGAQFSDETFAAQILPPLARGGQGGSHGSQLDDRTPADVPSSSDRRGGQRGADSPVTATHPLAVLHSAVASDYAPHFPRPALPRTPSPSMGEGEGGGDRSAGFQTARATPPKRSNRKPVWDANHHELRLGRQIVKRFRRRAPDQEKILAVFEEEGWPPTIDDPLTKVHGIDSKRHLNHTVRNLNRVQLPHLIRFSVLGQGERISWQLSPSRKPKRRRKRAARQKRRR